MSSDLRLGLPHHPAAAKVLKSTWQRCRVHFLRNALAHAGKGQRQMVLALPDRLLDGAKWPLWHGNVHRALQRLDTLVELVKYDNRLPTSPERSKLARTLNGSLRETFQHWWLAMTPVSAPGLL